MRPIGIHIIIFIISALAAGCAVGPNFHSPVAPATDKYTPSPLPNRTIAIKTQGGASQQFEFGRDIPAEWWQLFKSPQLDALIRQGINNSPNLQAAQAALRVAQENLRAEIGAGLFPSVNAALTANRQQFSGASNNTGDQTTIFSLYNASVNVTYTPDVFGGIRRQIEGFRAQAEFQRFQVEAAYLTLTANIVTTVITEASLRSQIAATHELVNAQQGQVDIARKQFQLGGISMADVLAQETQLAQTMSLLPPLEKNLAQVRHSLAVLVGDLPSENHAPFFDLGDLKLPTHLPVTLPSTLVRQRPDVRAAEATLHQASAQIGVATANLLPTFPLTGSWGYTNNDLNELFKPTSMVWSIGGQVLQPIFQGGALLAQRRSSIAAYDQAAAQYRQTVLVAFQNVADALRAIEIDAHALRAQAEFERTAYKTYRIVYQQYKLGAADYVALLVAYRAYQNARILRIQAEATRFADTAALFQALGGGWWNRMPADTAQVMSPAAAEKAADQLQAISLKTSKYAN